MDNCYIYIYLYIYTNVEMMDKLGSDSIFCTSYLDLLSVACIVEVLTSNTTPSPPNNVFRVWNIFSVIIAYRKLLCHS